VVHSKGAAHSTTERQTNLESTSIGVAPLPTTQGTDRLAVIDGFPTVMLRRQHGSEQLTHSEYERARGELTEHDHHVVGSF
jgi:hypothetical protein